MTCIVGLIANGRCYIGGDSAGVSGWTLDVRKDAKVFRVGPFVMGFTSSFRMGQLLRYSLKLPFRTDGAIGDSEQVLLSDPDRWMATDFVDAVRRCLKDGGYAEKDKEVEKGGTFLVGFRDRLYRIDSDYQIGVSADGYSACGCGEEAARGSLHATARLVPPLDPKERVKWALEAAERQSAGVRGPFVIEMTEGVFHA